MIGIFGYELCRNGIDYFGTSDDVYEKGYSENIWKAYNKSKNPIILFSDYAELRDGKIVLKNKLLTVKRIMLSPLKLSGLWNSRL